MRHVPATCVRWRRARPDAPGSVPRPSFLVTPSAWELTALPGGGSRRTHSPESCLTGNAAELQQALGKQPPSASPTPRRAACIANSATGLPARQRPLSSKCRTDRGAESARPTLSFLVSLHYNPLERARLCCVAVQARVQEEAEARLVAEKKALVDTVRRQAQAVARLESFRRNLLATLQSAPDVRLSQLLANTLLVDIHASPQTDAHACISGHKAGATCLSAHSCWRDYQVLC